MQAPESFLLGKRHFVQMCFMSRGVLSPDERVEQSFHVPSPWLAGVVTFVLGVVCVRRSGFALCRGKTKATIRVDVPHTLVLDPETELVSFLTDLGPVKSEHTLVEAFAFPEFRSFVLSRALLLCFVLFFFSFFSACLLDCTLSFQLVLLLAFFLVFLLACLCSFIGWAPPAPPTCARLSGRLFLAWVFGGGALRVLRHHPCTDAVKMVQQFLTRLKTALPDPFRAWGLEVHCGCFSTHAQVRKN